MGVYGNLLESVKYKLTPVSGKDEVFNSGIKFRKKNNIQISKFYNKNLELENVLEYLVRDFVKFKSNYDALETEVFKKLFVDNDDWYDDEDENPIKNYKQLMKMATLDAIEYYCKDNGNVGVFECYYNNYGQNTNFFGGHTLLITIKAEGSKVNIMKFELIG